MYRRPRYDIEDDYFVVTYINECQMLAQWASLTHEIANSVVRLNVYNEIHQEISWNQGTILKNAVAIICQN